MRLFVTVVLLGDPLSHNIMTTLFFLRNRETAEDRFFLVLAIQRTGELETVTHIEAVRNL